MKYTLYCDPNSLPPAYSQSCGEYDVISGEPIEERSSELMTTLRCGENGKTYIAVMNRVIRSFLIEGVE